VTISSSEFRQDILPLGALVRALLTFAAKLRHDVARARRQGISVRVLERSELSPEMRSALQQLDEDAARSLRLGKMSFSVGQRDDRRSLF
jgi:lysylphosphatidylglycerol synthetase-like protein (DUF2156 family)